MKITPLRSPHGFTIIETMIVLSIAALIAISALLVINGRLEKESFQLAGSSFVQSLQVILTDTGSGFYNNQQNFACNTASSPPQITPGTVNQGQNYGCVFLGTVVQLSPNDQTNTYVVYPVAGSEYSGSQAAQNISQATPFPVAPYKMGGVLNGAAVDLSQRMSFRDQLTSVTATAFGADGVPHQTGAIGFLAGDSSGNLNSYGADGLNSGRLPLSLYYVDNTGVDQDRYDVAGHINKTDLKPAGSIQLCLSNGGNASILMTVKGTNPSDISQAIKQGNSC